MIINCKVKDNSKTPVAIETTEVVALEGFLISESGHSGMEVGSEASSLYKEKWKIRVIFDPHTGQLDISEMIQKGEGREQ